MEIKFCVWMTYLRIATIAISRIHLRSAVQEFRWSKKVKSALTADALLCRASDAEKMRSRYGPLALCSAELWRSSVEATGVEPVSKHILQELSTCLSRFELSGINWKRATDQFLSWIVLSDRHSLGSQHPVLFFKSAAGLGNRTTCPAAQMTT